MEEYNSVVVLLYCSSCWDLYTVVYRLEISIEQYSVFALFPDSQI